MPLPKRIPRFYDYFEERPFSGTKGERRLHVAGCFPKNMSEDEALESHPTNYAWWKARELEGRVELPPQEGVWGISYWRAEKLFGTTTEFQLAWDTPPDKWPTNIESLARRYRLHHYYRVWSATECQEAIKQNEVRTAVEITDDWFDPPAGVIPDPADGAVVLGSHAIPIKRYDPATQRFHFPNSWGLQWGQRRRGSLSAWYFDNYLVEAWCRVGVGITPLLSRGRGLTWLLWKSAFNGREVFGRELVDPTSGNHLAWAFATRRGSYLDLEEFFVAPVARRKGYARRLVSLVFELRNELSLPLRAWVPFADCEPANRPALRSLMRLFGLHIHPSPHRSAAFLARSEPLLGELPEPRIPHRPASIREKLSPEAGTRLYTVWYGTNRKPVESRTPGHSFSGDRDDRLHYGKCQVAIPKSHKLGSVGSSWFMRWIRCQDDRLHVVEDQGMSEGEFWTSIRASIEALAPTERQALVFLHGYRVSFSQAAVWAAQLGFDLKVPGVTAFFSWPSRGKKLDYLRDRDSIQASEPAIVEFLDRLVRDSGATVVHLIAHSMGNQGLLRAVQRICARGAENSIRFGQIILAAPDVDQGVFKELASLYPSVSQRTTLYASPKDSAVSLSRWLHDHPRAGLTPPVTVMSGIDTVEVKRLDMTDFRWHSYFSQAESVLRDIFDLLRRNAPPSDRVRLSPATTEAGDSYWVME